MTLIDKAEALLPCPFCGGDDMIILNGPVEDDWCAVSCEKCQARGPTDYTDPHAIASWNRRAALPARGVGVPTDEPEAGEVRAVIVNAKWKPCVHGGGWWVAQDADGRPVSLAPDGFAALEPAPTAAKAREAALDMARDKIDAMRRMERDDYSDAYNTALDDAYDIITRIIGEKPADPQQARFLPVCECGMTGPCMWDQCKHPLIGETRA